MNERINAVLSTNCEDMPTDKELVCLGSAHKKID